MNATSTFRRRATSLDALLTREELSHDDIVAILAIDDPRDLARLQAAASAVAEREVGTKVYYRGLLEFSNRCRCDCYYCGIRKSNARVERFTLGEEEIVAVARRCAAEGYGSIMLQSGERRDEPFIALVERAVRRIKRETAGPALPQGLGVSLCVGEQSRETYERFHAAGAHRYLLRIETSSPSLFARLHPASQSLRERAACIDTLREIGFLVGTGVMIGLPGQSLDDLASDILFFREHRVGMVGMGPYIPHGDTPMAGFKAEYDQRREALFRLSLKMIAAVRLTLRAVNIAATTALQTIHPFGREWGIRFGANIVMPLVTPAPVRTSYRLYDGKPCLDEDDGACLGCLAARVATVGHEVGMNEWGDPPRWRSLDAADRTASRASGPSPRATVQPKPVAGSDEEIVR